MKKLRIAQIAPLWIPVPPRTYGGIELMVHNLTEELVRRGHDITLFASGDSRTSARLVSPLDKALWLQKDLKNPHAAIIKMLQMIRERASEFDIIHNHFNFFMFPLATMPNMPPILTSIRRPLDSFYNEAIKSFPSIYFNVLSEDAKKSAEEFSIPIADVVNNGIEIEKYSYNATPDDYLLYLGRINREKGIITALRVAKAIGKRLIVAGNIVSPAEWLFFMQEVQPQLNEENIKFVGQANFQEKIDLLRNAKAFLFPIAVREAFGNVMIEAMACGTPVIAFNRGSVSEVVADGKTGFIVDTEEEMIEAVEKISNIERQECRKRVEERFTLRNMVDKYEKLFAKIISRT